MFTKPLLKSTFENNFSMLFDGVNEFCDLGDVANFDNNDPFSVSVWFNTTQTGFAHFINRIKSSSPFNGWQFYKANDQKLTFSLINNNVSNTIQLNGTTLVNDGLWNNAILTYDGSSAASGVRIYFNGVAESIVIVLDTLSLSTLVAQNLFLGKRSDGAGHVNGKLDEAAVFNRELSAAEALDIYNNGKPQRLPTSDLINWIRFTQLDIDNFPTLADNSGNGNDGIAVNMESGDIQTDVP